MVVIIIDTISISITTISIVTIYLVLVLFSLSQLLLTLLLVITSIVIVINDCYMLLFISVSIMTATGHNMGEPALEGQPLEGCRRP